MCACWFYLGSPCVAYGRRITPFLFSFVSYSCDWVYLTQPNPLPRVVPRGADRVGRVASRYIHVDVLTVGGWSEEWRMLMTGTHDVCNTTGWCDIYLILLEPLCLSVIFATFHGTFFPCNPSYRCHHAGVFPSADVSARVPSAQACHARFISAGGPEPATPGYLSVGGNDDGLVVHPAAAAATGTVVACPGGMYP